jgi:hypothetical protein
LWRVRSMRFEHGASDTDARALGLASTWQLENFRKKLSLFRDPAYFDGCFEHLLEADAALKSQGGEAITVVTRLLLHLIPHAESAGK